MCLSPFRATRDYTIENKGSFSKKENFGKIRLCSEGELLLPCGKCTECISKRAFDWATRCRHEISEHEESTFITLTYDDENLKKINPIHFKREFQLFMKKLRKLKHEKLRYIVSHEYGGKTGRPHHHAIIFGYNPQNQYHFTNSPSGEKLYRSDELEKLWKNGISSIGEANEKTAFYIASYSLKSSNITAVHPDSGEIITLSDTMDASKRPAIGKTYFEKHAEQLAHSNTLLPRYYQKLMEKSYPHLLEVYENASMLRQNKTRTPHQILAKHVITEQKREMQEKSLRSEIDQRTLTHTTKHLKQLRDQSDAIFNSEKEKL